MTFAVGHVHGGTGAGRKRPLAPAYIPWACACTTRDNPDFDPKYRMIAEGAKVNPGYLVRCIDCGVRRDDARG